MMTTPGDGGDLPSVGATADPVDLSLRQFGDAWRVMCASAPARAITRADGLDYIFSGTPIGFFNIALLTGSALSATTLTEQARQATAWAADKGVPWMFVVTHERLADGLDPAAALDASGLAPVLALTGMRAQQIAPLSESPDGLTLIVPQDDPGCAAMVDLNSLAYGMDLEASKDIIGTGSFWKDHFPVLGLTDGKPACSATVLMVDGHRYVALVATDPGQQRRGYAAAAMRRALDLSAAAHGEIPTLLHATDAGRPVYARMGYETISTHTIFMEKRFLEGH